MSPEKTVTALRAAAAIAGGFGAIVALAALAATAGIANLLADLVFCPIDGAPRIDTPAARLLAAIAGGVLVGWG